MLIEAIQAVETETFAGIPDSLIKLERKYKTELSYLERRRYEEEIKNGSINRKELKRINDKILATHKKQEKLTNLFRKNHEDYFKLLYEPEFVAINQIQQNLIREDQTMISYFVGESKIYAFIIGNSLFEVVQIENIEPLISWLEEFRNSIYHFNPADNKSAYLNQKLANIG